MRSRTRYNCHKSRQLVSLNYVIAVREEQRHLRGSLAAGTVQNVQVWFTCLTTAKAIGRTSPLLLLYATAAGSKGRA
jgi:hypothetical protein